jgi:drug/metabolite transporter (DMT)-like permease
MSFDAVLTLRSAIAAPIMWAWALATRGWAPFRDASIGGLWAALLAGALCYCIGAALDFYALSLIDASVERVLLYSYPSMVVLAGFLLGRGQPSRSAIATVLATYVGIFLVMGGLDSRLLRTNLNGAGLVLICAATFCVYFFISEKYTREMGSQPFVVIAMTSASIGLAILYYVRNGWHPLPSLDAHSWMMMGGLTLFASVLPMFMVAEGVRRIGAERAALASTIGPVATLVLAASLLGERLSRGQLLGAALIVGAIVILELRVRAVPEEA